MTMYIQRAEIYGGGGGGFGNFATAMHAWHHVPTLANMFAVQIQSAALFAGL